MTIDVQRVRTRLEAKQAELQHEIAGLISGEAYSARQGQGVEDVGETAQTFQEVQREESILQNLRHLPLMSKRPSVACKKEPMVVVCPAGSRSQSNGSKPFPGQYEMWRAKNGWSADSFLL